MLTQLKKLVLTSYACATCKSPGGDVYIGCGREIFRLPARNDRKPLQLVFIFLDLTNSTPPFCKNSVLIYTSLISLEDIGDRG